jgi:hypothetical protein
MTRPDLLQVGIYTIPDAAELVGAPQATVRVWVEGHTGKQAPVIQNELGRVGGKTAVSFANLMELRFISRFAQAGVRLNEIRAIMSEAGSMLQHRTHLLPARCSRPMAAMNRTKRPGSR